MTDPGNLIELNIKPRPRIIVADDEQDIATLIEDWLSDTFEVTLALNGKAALQKAAWQKPDVILCDIVMPDMGGYEVVRALQSNPQTQSVPIIIMTAKNYDDSTVAMIKAEPNVLGFIVKPFKPSVLVKMIHTVLGGQRTFEGAPPPVASPAVVLTSPPTVPPVEPPAGLVSAAEPVEENLPRPSSYETSLALHPEGGAMSRRNAPSPRAATPPRVVLDSLVSSKKQEKTAKGWMKRIAVSLALIGVLLVGGAEWMCRWTEQSLSSRVFLPPIRLARHGELPYQFEPNAHWTDGGISYRINAWGLRDKNFDLVASSGVVRVLLLGGTTVFGLGLDDNAILSQRLEDRLRSLLPPGESKVQVINAAHWAYSPEEQWAYYEKEGFQFRPEVVVWLAEPRSGESPSREGLRQLAEWSGWFRGVLGQSRLFRVMALRRVRKAPPSEETPLSTLGPQAESFINAEGSRLVALVPSGQKPKGSSFYTWDFSSGVSREGMTLALLDRLAPLVAPLLLPAVPAEAPPVVAPPLREKEPPKARPKRR